MRYWPCNMYSLSGESRFGADQHLSVHPLQRGCLPGLQPLLRCAEPAPWEAGGHVERGLRGQTVSGRLCTGGTFQQFTAGWKLQLLGDLEFGSNHLAQLPLTICSTIPNHLLFDCSKMVSDNSSVFSATLKIYSLEGFYTQDSRIMVIVFELFVSWPFVFTNQYSWPHLFSNLCSICLVLLYFYQTFHVHPSIRPL